MRGAETDPGPTTEIVTRWQWIYVTGHLVFVEGFHGYLLGIVALTTICDVLASRPRWGESALRLVNRNADNGHEDTSRWTAGWAWAYDDMNQR